MGFDTDTFLVREHVGMFKLHEAYDILTPDGQTMGTAIERVSTMRQILKLILDKNMLPFTVEIMDANQRVLVTIRRPFTIFRSVVTVSDESGAQIGHFRQRLLSLGGAFDVFDAANQPLATLKGDWKGWNFKFTDADGVELGQVTRKWGGLAKELFTSADNYVVHIERERIADVRHVQVMLAAALCIDMVLKETGG